MFSLVFTNNVVRSNFSQISANEIVCVQSHPRDFRASNVDEEAGWEHERPQTRRGQSNQRDIVIPRTAPFEQSAPGLQRPREKSVLAEIRRALGPSSSARLSTVVARRVNALEINDRRVYCVHPVQCTGRSRGRDKPTHVGSEKIADNARGSRSSARAPNRGMLIPCPRDLRDYGAAARIGGAKSPRDWPDVAVVALDRRVHVGKRSLSGRRIHTWLRARGARSTGNHCLLFENPPRNLRGSIVEEPGRTIESRKIHFTAKIVSSFSLVLRTRSDEQTAATAIYPFAATADVALPPAATIKGSYRRQDRSCSICGTSSTPIDRIIVNEQLAMINRRFYYDRAIRRELAPRRSIINELSHSPPPVRSVKYTLVLVIQYKTA